MKSLALRRHTISTFVIAAAGLFVAGAACAPTDPEDSVSAMDRLQAVSGSYDGSNYDDRVRLLRDLKAAHPLPARLADRDPRAGIISQTEWQRDSKRSAYAWWTRVNYSLSMWQLRALQRFNKHTDASIVNPDVTIGDPPDAISFKYKQFVESVDALNAGTRPTGCSDDDCAIRVLTRQLWDFHYSAIEVALPKADPATLPNDVEREFAVNWGEGIVPVLTAMNYPTNHHYAQECFGANLPPAVMTTWDVGNPPSSSQLLATSIRGGGAVERWLRKNATSEFWTSSIMRDAAGDPYTSNNSIILADFACKAFSALGRQDGEGDPGRPLDEGQAFGDIVSKASELLAHANGTRTVHQALMYPDGSVIRRSCPVLSNGEVHFGGCQFWRNHALPAPTRSGVTWTSYDTALFMRGGKRMVRETLVSSGSNPERKSRECPVLTTGAIDWASCGGFVDTDPNFFSTIGNGAIATYASFTERHGSDLCLVQSQILEDGHTGYARWTKYDRSADGRDITFGTQDCPGVANKGWVKVELGTDNPKLAPPDPNNALKPLPRENQIYGGYEGLYVQGIDPASSPKVYQSLVHANNKTDRVGQAWFRVCDTYKPGATEANVGATNFSSCGGWAFVQLKDRFNLFNQDYTAYGAVFTTFPHP